MEEKKFEHRLKIYRDGILILLMLVASFSFWKFVDTYSQRVDSSTLKSFTVSGEGEVIAVPDVAEFTFSVITEGKDLSVIQKENTEKMNSAIKFLKDSGIKDEDIKTQNYNVSPRYEYYPCNFGESCPPPKIVGYNISQSVLVKARDFGKVGDLLAGVVKNGANSVSQMRLAIDDPSEFQNKAREEAIKKAKEKAVSIAKAGGFKLGDLLSIEEGGMMPTPRYAESIALGMGGGDMKDAPNIVPGSEEIKITMTLRYEIED